MGVYFASSTQKATSLTDITRAPAANDMGVSAQPAAGVGARIAALRPAHGIAEDADQPHVDQPHGRVRPIDLVG